MKKKFHTFGFSGKDKNWLVNKLSEIIEVEFQITSGKRYVYNFGDIGNRVSIFDNYLEEDDWWQEEKFKHFPILVKLSLINQDQEQEFVRVKNILENVSYLTKIRNIETD